MTSSDNVLVIVDVIAIFIDIAIINITILIANTIAVIIHIAFIKFYHYYQTVVLNIYIKVGKTIVLML